jgi:hypothetical protein
LAALFIGNAGLFNVKNPTSGELVGLKGRMFVYKSNTPSASINTIMMAMGITYFKR